MALTDFVLTDVGRALIARAALGEEMVFTRGAVGKGALSAGSESQKRTQMCDAVADMNVCAPEVSGDTLRVRCQFTNADGSGGYIPAFRLNECGLFGRLKGDAQDVLIAYGNTFDANAGDLIAQTECEFEIEFAIAISGAEQMQFSSTGLIFATQEDLKTHTQSASTITAGVLAGKVLANASAAALGDKQVRNIVIATVEPDSAAEGDIWLSYS